MELEQAIRGRRTHKAYAPEPIDPRLLDELLELATWAPNHRLTNPWRFRVVGPRSLARLKAAGEPQDAPKLDRAPTLVLVTVEPSEDPVTAQEDRDAAAVAAYLVLLGAHGRGLGGYWRTPGVLRTDDGRAALGVGAREQVVGLLHLGRPRQEPRVPARTPLGELVTRLD